LRHSATNRKLQSFTILTINQVNQTIGENIMKEKVEKALEKVRPMLQADGGDVELVDVQDGIVTVRLQGACGGCPMSQMTLKNGIERILKEEVPEVVSVESAP
jgi:Fe-S cluster biogenesis protein NfuA